MTQVCVGSGLRVPVAGRYGFRSSKLLGTSLPESK
jgi:hypothetical protein